MHKRLWILGLVGTSLVLTGCPETRRPAGSSAGKTGQSSTAKPASGEKPGTPGPIGDYARTLDKSEKKAAEITGQGMLTQAVQQFNVLEGRYPRTLDELVESRYLSKLPVAPRGKRFIYNPKSGDVTVEPLAVAAPAATPEQPTEPKVEPTATPAPASENAPEAGQ